MKLEVLSCVNGRFGTNCYLLRDTESGDTAAIDCAVYDSVYRNFLEENDVKELKYIIATHGHFDHVVGIGKLNKEHGGQVCIYETEKECLVDEMANLNGYNEHFPGFEPVEPDILLHDVDTLPFGDGKIRVMYTPGHTSGCICLFAGEHLFSGDTLFRMSMGRTDLPTGSTKQLFESLEKLGKIEGDFIVYPGHGQTTTLEFEKRNNRYLRH